MTGDYADDYQDWLAQTAWLIRERRWQALNAEHLADEVEDFRSPRRSGAEAGVASLQRRVEAGR